MRTGEPKTASDPRSMITWLRPIAKEEGRKREPAFFSDANYWSRDVQAELTEQLRYSPLSVAVSATDTKWGDTILKLKSLRPSDDQVRRQMNCSDAHGYASYGRRVLLGWMRE